MAAVGNNNSIHVGVSRVAPTPGVTLTWPPTPLIPNCGATPAAASPGNLLETQISRSGSKPAESEALRVRAPEVGGGC